MCGNQRKSSIRSTLPPCFPDDWTHCTKTLISEEEQWAKINNDRKRRTVVQWKGMFRKIADLSQHRRQLKWIFLFLNLAQPLPTKLSGVSFTNPISAVGSVAIAEPLITESNAQMRKRWYHGHKTWTLPCTRLAVERYKATYDCSFVRSWPQ
jgi:hypothetical protein